MARYTTRRTRGSRGRRATRTRSLTRSSRFKQHQYGGYVGMPLAYFKDGAQMQGTTTDPTGVGLGGSTGAWSREAIQQIGGSVKRRARVTGRRQVGGFHPSVMGAFVANGMRIAPAAVYSGYKLFQNQRKTRKGRRGHRSRRN